MAGIERKNLDGSPNRITPERNEDRMLTPMERTPVPARSSTCTAQKQNAPPTTHQKPHSNPISDILNVPVAKPTTSALISTPKVIIERYAQLEYLGHFFKGTM
jgi:hypothetical protein